MENTGYHDSNGKEYKVGDIVYNKYLQNYWVVKRFSDYKDIHPRTSCKYFLLEYGINNTRYVNLYDNTGCMIILSADNENYMVTLTGIQRIGRTLYNL